MVNRSSFTKENNYTPDVFAELFDLSPSQVNQAQRYKYLQVKAGKSPEEIQEFSALRNTLQNYIISPSRWNHFSDALMNMQWFIKNEVSDYVDEMQQQVEDYTDQKQLEIEGTVADYTAHVENEKVIITSYVDGKKIEMNLYADDKLNQVQLTMTESINTMENKKDLFITYVNTKQDEVQKLVQDFDSRTARYYQEWYASDGQTDFNIFNGLKFDIPQEAMLILSEKDLDVIVQGTSLRPNVDYEIVNNNLYDTIRLKGNAPSLISSGTEISVKWYKNVGKLYFTHAATHELGGSDEIKNIQEPQLNPDLRSKINTGNITISTMKPASGMWYKVIG